MLVKTRADAQPRTPSIAGHALLRASAFTAWCVGCAQYRDVSQLSAGRLEHRLSWSVALRAVSGRRARLHAAAPPEFGRTPPAFGPRTCYPPCPRAYPAGPALWGSRVCASASAAAHVSVSASRRSPPFLLWAPPCYWMPWLGVPCYAPRVAARPLWSCASACAYVVCMWGVPPSRVLPSPPRALVLAAWLHVSCGTRRSGYSPTSRTSAHPVRYQSCLVRCCVPFRVPRRASDVWRGIALPA